MVKPNSVIIIGGGASINEGIKKGLWDKLKNKFTIGCNATYKFFDSTITCVVDGACLREQSDFLCKLPLVISRKNNVSINKKWDNLIVMPFSSANYHQDLKGGVYSNKLCGLFSLSIGIFLIGGGDVYLIGADGGNPTGAKDKKGRQITHFYQGKFEHRGIAKVSYYNAQGRMAKIYDVYKQAQNIKIYNVSIQSRIPSFEKITYDEFFKQLETCENYDQKSLVAMIKEKLNPLQLYPKK